MFLRLSVRRNAVKKYMDIDKWIIDGLSAGKEEAYKYIYDKYYNVLCLLAYQYVKDTFIAETIVGDVVFHIWQKRDEIVISQSLRSYLTKAVKNRCLNYLEQQKRQEDIKSYYTEKLNADQINYKEQPEYPLNTLLEKELDVKIEGILNSMPELTQRIFALSRFSNLKYHEIAQETGVTVDVVKYHIKSALSRLRGGLKDYLFIIIALFYSFL